jgi:hypothetical protein
MMLSNARLCLRGSRCAEFGGRAAGAARRGLRSKASTSLSAARRLSSAAVPPPPPPPPPHEDGMSRWPGLLSARGQLRALDYAGTLAFASSGAAAAALTGMDALGAVVVGTVTAVGGGTIRDAVILRKIPFWTEEVEYLYLSIAAAGATFLAWPRNEDGSPKEHFALQWADAFGVGAFATIGAQNAIRASMPALVTVCSTRRTLPHRASASKVPRRRQLTAASPRPSPWRPTPRRCCAACRRRRSAGRCAT